MSSIYFNEDALMWDIIRYEPKILQAMSRFCIPLGVGEHSVREVCETNGVDTDTFIAVANFIKHGEECAELFVDKINVAALMDYLRNAHDYFLNFQFPKIRRKLIEAVDCSEKNEVAFLILQFYDAYTSEVRKHMQFENNKIFTYVKQQLSGEYEEDRSAPSSKELELYLRGHDAIESKLKELKNLLVKYGVPAANVNFLNDVVFNIYTCEDDLTTHCAVENKLFIPAVSKLELKNTSGQHANSKTEKDKDKEDLSTREKEVLACAVRGMTNKEIAENLFISLNTVLTHRKNISRKLNIHSISGLTIYAIVNKLVNLDEVKTKGAKKRKGIADF